MADCDEKQLKSLSRPHTDSFNYSFGPEGLANFVKYFGNFYHSLKDGSKLKLFLEAIEIEKPRITRSGQECSVFPTECRQRNTTYRGQLLAQIGVKLNGEYKGCFVKSIGYLPIMVGSSFCNTSNLDENEMYRKGEEVSDPGGYFIVKGFQKFLRLLVMYRRNYPICEKKAIWKSRGENFTEYGINMRCVRGDQTAANTIFHHLIDDSVVICIVYQKELFFVPILLIMKCLINCTDYSLLKFMLQWEPNNKQYESSVIQMLFSLADNSVFTQQDALKFIGQRFRHKTDCPEWFSNEKIGKYIIKNLIAIHLDNNNDKLSFLAYVYHKLFRFANGHIEAENSDSISYQEVLTPGNMIQIVLKERLTKWFEYLINSIEAKSSSITLANCDLNSISNIASGVVDISQSIEYFFSTGNFSTKNSYGLRQLSGFVMQADYINFTMFISNFCAIHRGTSFSGTTNTNVRKLLPSHWGFICPLNTPDGDPCGLLNYLTYCSSICFASFDKNIIRKFLYANQVVPISIGDEIENITVNSYINVILDGVVIGKTSLDNARKLKRIIRVMRIKQIEPFHRFTELLLIENTPEYKGLYPALFISCDRSRIMREVYNLEFKLPEYIGTMEQMDSKVAIYRKEVKNLSTDIQEIEPYSFLSVVGSLTPFPECNPSARNIYQCQMSKQTIGTTVHNLNNLTESKQYQLITPQNPLSTTANYDKFSMPDHAQGTNVIVAVISHTGYDMEDAIIINRHSLQRGLFNANFYKTLDIDLSEVTGNKMQAVSFGCTKEGIKHLDKDGLPKEGSHLVDGDPLYSYIVLDTGECIVKPYKGFEKAVVEKVRLLGDDVISHTRAIKAAIVIRINRYPDIGDKFASRHGQKGVCSLIYDPVDMPFCQDSGTIPDILFNPHGYPTRMTIGMILESMSSKAAAAHGSIIDATPFKYTKLPTTENDIGQAELCYKMLKTAGFDQMGTECMIDGQSGECFKVQIFIGPVYYQRLRHMVADKFQVRIDGPVDILTKQPVKGRKRGGGIRFGEMERDTLISHGASASLRDRLFLSSDKSKMLVCTNCSNFLCVEVDKSLSYFSSSSSSKTLLNKSDKKYKCCLCDSKAHISYIEIPYVFKYLLAELSMINIKVKPTFTAM